ncbi:hypothetical protein [Prochlorococcus marinus]|uniref:Uncharacterized protein n=1 Tax=Prochlorococcus marinus XMU1408 TaxID=2213228 RepID=A0A318R1N9_PROMR|nr:hypothetical protein [Prochlorococcus marinus]MBW3041071.1 hypothetical protein [Prochlorococcus marinus str. XMU1408]PYE03676.1 hypothetical protein DNJ73_00360 [Prochlorococcus marinus XMU1408]
MSLGITELELTDVNTISIPTDAISTLSLLIIFALLGYFFHKILNTQTNQFFEKINDDSNLELVKEKLEDKLMLESTKVNQERVEKPFMKKVNFLSPSKLLGMSSMTVVAIGGASLLGIQAMQNSNQGVNVSQVKVKSKNQSAKTFLSVVKLQSLNKAQNKIKKINYIDPLLSAINSSTHKNFYQFTASKAEDFFSF